MTVTDDTPEVPGWDPAELVTVTGVEIVQTGIEYPLASGPKTFTTTDLAAAVDSQSDPAIKFPRLRLGHEGLNDPEWDGEPAIGIVSNMRLEQSGHTIVGDYENIPEWLALALPSAYPGRSIDGEIGVVTNTGHTWDLVITGLALLGVRWPGVSTLDDIKALYSKDMPDSVKVYSTEEVDEVTVAAAGTPVTARLDVDVVRRQYYSSLEGSEAWNMWIRGQYYDPDELIVEDESTGDLYRVPYTISGQEVEFGDKVAVIEEFIDKPKQPEKAEAIKAAMIGINLYHKPVVLYATRDDSREDIEVAVETEQPQELQVDPVAMRRLLGLGDDASDEDLQAALSSAGFIAPPGGEGGGNVAPGSEQPGTSESGSATPGNDTADNTAPDGANDPAKAEPVATASADLMTIDKATLEQLQADAAAGRQARDTQLTDERDIVISAAIKAGRIPPSRKAHYEAAWKSDPQGTKHLLTAAADKGGLAPGLVPVKEDGANPSNEDLSVEAYPTHWLPEVEARQDQERIRAQQAQSARPFNVIIGG